MHICQLLYCNVLVYHACGPSELELEATESPEVNQIRNETATDHAKRLFKWIDVALPAIERRMVDTIYPSSPFIINNDPQWAFHFKNQDFPVCLYWHAVPVSLKNHGTALSFVKYCY